MEASHEHTVGASPGGRGIAPGGPEPDVAAPAAHPGPPIDSFAAAVDVETESWRLAKARAFEERARARPQSARWYLSRARTMREGWATSIDACGSPSDAVIRCTSCRAMHPAPFECRRRSLCGRCSDKHFRRVRRRVLPSVDRLRAELRRMPRRAPIRCGDPSCGCARVAKRCAWDTRLVTLTVSHSGSLETDRATLERGWVRLRAWLHYHLDVAPSYVRVTECTPSDAGHVHLHLVLGVPPICYRWLGEEWESATDGAAAPQGLDVSTCRDSDRAAKYVAKYVTKGSGALDVSTAAAWVCASYGRRTLVASRGTLGPWLRSECPECHETALEWGRLVTVDAPQSGAQAAHGPRGPPTDWRAVLPRLSLGLSHST